MLQDLVADGRPLYRHVAEYVERIAGETAGACGYGAVGAVVGATYPAQLAELRAGNAAHLVPGPRFRRPRAARRPTWRRPSTAGSGAIVNNSRGIIFAHQAAPYAERFGTARWQEAVEAATRDMIEQLCAETPAGRVERD